MEKSFYKKETENGKSDPSDIPGDGIEMIQKIRDGREGIGQSGAERPYYGCSGMVYQHGYDGYQF